eukprot:s3224_g6.t1
MQACLGDQVEVARPLKLHAEVTTVFSEECIFLDDMDIDQAACVPSLSMLAHQKLDVELQLRALDVQHQRQEEEDNFLVTKTIAVDQVYQEWDQWAPAMLAEYESIVHEKKAVRQMPRTVAQQTAAEKGLQYEKLPSKVVFTQKIGGKYEVRACICGNFEKETSASTYAGGCDASQIRCAVRHPALQKWDVFCTDIKCAFLNAERQDHSKVITMTVPNIYVKLGVAKASDVWVVDAAMYGLTTSPRDWAEHRGRMIPDMAWTRSEGSLTWTGIWKFQTKHLWHLREQCLETGEVVNCGLMAVYVDDVLLAAKQEVATSALKAIAEVWECAKPEQALLDQPVSLCGFEIQKNDAEHGGGFRLHQAKYEASQVYYYAGAPVMWNTNRQAFPTQSTAESEFVGLCEALVGGRATTVLVAAIRDEEEEEEEEMLRRCFWGDNSAAISLATGDGQGSWRTRHLRIRAAILRSALQRGEWELGHLNGKELVADSFAKVVDGVTFCSCSTRLGCESIEINDPERRWSAK